ncbi:MAG: sigma-70 family RNA polymerase sigma factor [Clostridia bacterium]|nr:sigma-70 family RNA polymerase sigma factor [Clostridia bacterium]
MINADEMKLIITENNERLYKYCLRILRDRSAAEDVTNDVWLVLIRKRSNLRQGADIAAYIFRVADKCILRWRRANAKRTIREVPLDETLYSSGDPQGVDEYFKSDKSDTELLKDVMMSLPDESRELFRLRFIEKRNLEDIAKLTDTPYSTVRLHLEKIKLLAKKIIERGDYCER